MALNVVLLVVESEVVILLMCSPHQNIAPVHVTVLKLKCLRVEEITCDMIQFRAPLPQFKQYCIAM